MAALSCSDCAKYLVDDDWQITRRPARVGLPVLRPKGTPLPCASCPKIPAGEHPSPRNAVELSERNLRAWWHWRQARAVGFTRRERADPIVRRNAALIQDVYDAVERQQAHERNSQLLLGMLAGITRGGVP